jgi:hypothetical protein
MRLYCINSAFCTYKSHSQNVSVIQFERTVVKYAKMHVHVHAINAILKTEIEISQL